MSGGLGWGLGPGVRRIASSATSWASSQNWKCSSRTNASRPPRMRASGEVEGQLRNVKMQEYLKSRRSA